MKNRKWKRMGLIAVVLLLDMGWGGCDVAKATAPIVTEVERTNSLPGDKM